MLPNALATTVRNFYKPSWWQESAIPYAQTRLLNRYADTMRWKTADVMAADWDTLIVLDACRYDTFKQTTSLPGKLSTVTSAGSSTQEFLDQNFNDDSTHHDTVYVTANPMYRINDWVSTSFDNTFHAVADVWEDSWDEQLHTVTPDSMVEATLEAAERYPRKRLFIHFIQPHIPFIGPTGRNELSDQNSMEIARGRARGEWTDTRINVWDLLEEGELDRDTVWRAYVENLEVAVPHVETLLDTLKGRHVVTSDHGDLFGEYAWPFPFKLYGHPEGVRTPKLTTVPWQVVHEGPRREITSDPPETDHLEEDGAVSDRLRDLGYR